jgi:hypothetical protein
MDVVNRAELEQRLARVIGRDQRVALNELLGFLGDPPAIENVPLSYWDTGWRAIQKDVEPALLDTYLQQAEGLMAEINIGIEWDQLNLTASNWAATYSEQLLKQMFNRTYEGVSQVVPRFYTEGWNINQLTGELERWYSPVRAEMIAVTETTRAATEGERAVAEQLNRESGIELVPVWLTVNDELVCPICGARNEKQIVDGKFPPAHPRCRCTVAWKLPEVKK